MRMRKSPLYMKSVAGFLLLLMVIAIVVAVFMMGRPARSSEMQWTTIHSDSHVTEAMRIAGEIMEALEEYKVDHLRYPRSLRALVPEYLPTIPDCPAGNPDWNYEADRHSYTLRFGYSGDFYPGYYIDTRDGREWQLDF